MCNTNSYDAEVILDFLSYAFAIPTGKIVMILDKVKKQLEFMFLPLYSSEINIVPIQAIEKLCAKI